MKGDYRQYSIIHYAFQSGILLFCFAIMIQFHVKFLDQFGIFKFNSVMLHFDTVCVDFSFTFGISGWSVFGSLIPYSAV